MNKVKIALLGYGYWGPNILRNFYEMDDVEVAWCCDLSKERLILVEKRYLNVKTTTNLDDLLKDPKLDAIIIATPVSTHFALAKKILEAGKHVWIEKPMTQTSLQAKELIEIAEKKKKIIHVDHIFLYTHSVSLIKKMINEGELGDLYYFDSVRINLGLFQHDTNVIWDLAPHDISIMLYFLNEDPIEVSTYANAHVVNDLEDTAYLSFKFKNRVSAHINVSWLSPLKIRRTLIAGSKKMIVYDDLESSDKVKIYDKGLTYSKPLKSMSTAEGYQYRTGEMRAPAIENVEALQIACREFVNAIRSGKSTITDGKEGLRVVKILEASITSLKNNGAFTQIK